MFRFASPFAFFLFIPLLIAAWWIYCPRIRRGLLFASASRTVARRGSWRTGVSSLLTAITLVGLALAVLALARPQKVFSRTAHTSDAIAIQMVVDISGSMNALDFASLQDPQRTRLEVVKETFAEFVELRADDLVGLITFGGYATSRVPLTIDHNALRHVLDGVEVPRYRYDGRDVINADELATALGDGLATACARLKDAEVKSKIVLLLSDGESNTGIVTPDKAMQLAAKLGIKVYTIGVGSSGVAQAVFNDASGRNLVTRMRVELDEALLKQVARETGGLYFNVRDPHGLQQALDQIDQLEKTEINREVYSQYKELFPPYLSAGITLMALGLCMNMALSRKLI
ncbi:MAG: VWA domain-containing protein [Verrucomicrobia bacterium]|nr:VWA domain-containing protein [Verrucomicrobiota bacterium]MDA1085623.1 VWA domain-containing protein [Verrucomicrobiota bacterium]